MNRKSIVILVTILTSMLLIWIVSEENAVLESTTENILVLSKGQNPITAERWIVLSNGREIHIEDTSIWALVQENENYTIVYDLSKKSGEYRLRTIVPGDYQGQF